MRIRNGFTILFIFICFFSFAQSDTNITHGTIKVSKQKDTIYVKTFTRFVVYAKPVKDGSSYQDFVSATEMVNSVVLPRVQVKEAHPAITGKRPRFSFTDYFRKNQSTSSIRLHSGEKDTVRLFIAVDKNGMVKFLDLGNKEVIGHDTVYYNLNKTAYKLDMSHAKTQKAFRELLNENWEPAQIQTLKKHPSQKKDPYSTSTAYMQGELMIVYSSMPFDE